MSRFILLACSSFLVASLIPPALAQTPTAALTGVVGDSVGVAVEGAVVLARDLNTGFEYKAHSAASGRYWLPGLPPGNYEVSVQRLGFQSPAKRNLVLAIGQTVQLNFNLGTVPIVLQEFEVIAAPPLIETTESDVAFVLDQKQIAALPQESRRFIDLAQLAPGATTGIQIDNSGGRLGTVAIGALNAHSTGVLVDGGDLTLGSNNNVAGGIPLLAIQEFEVVTTRYAPEFGRAASGVINAVTRRGSNHWSFEGFGLYRHQALNARGAFERTKPEFNRSHLGFAFGGPLSPNRTHLFAAFERKDEDLFSTVETDGIFPDQEGSFKTPFTDNLLFARIDHRPSHRHEFTFRYSGQVLDELAQVGQRGVCGTGLTSFEFGTDQRRRMHSGLLMHRWRLGERTVNAARFHVLHWNWKQQPMGSNPALQYPTLCVGSNPFRFDLDDSRVELRNDLSTVISGAGGTHLVKVGTHLSWVHSDLLVSWFRNGLFIFPSDTSSNPFAALIGFRDAHTTVGNWLIGVYAQDDWNPTPNLTLNLGVRFDVETSPTNQRFVSPHAGDLPIIPTDPRPVDKNNIAPRFGLAWDPYGKGSTVLRGGIGIFYDQQMTQFKFHETNDRFFVGVLNPSSTDVDSIALPDPVPASPQVLDREMKTPMTRQYSLGFEQALWGNFVVRVDGMVSQGRNIMVARALNTIGPSGFRYPEFGPVTQYLNRGEAEARILMFQLRKEYPIGRTHLSYTLADRKVTQDKWWGEFAPQVDPDREDFESELGPAAWDERHRIVATGDLRLSKGVGVAVKAIYSSARPFNIVTGFDGNGDFSLNDRPMGVGRNSGRGSDYFIVDLGLKWAIPIENGAVDLTTNIYNLFNRTNFDSRSVIGNLQSAAFGRALGAGPKRQIELGVMARF